MKKGYIAGKLFKDADIKQRQYEESNLKVAIPEVRFHNPISDEEANDKSKQPTARTIFLNDTRKVIEADYIIAELDDEDPGVCMELGIAYGITYVLDLLEMYGEKAVLNMIHKKKVFAHCSDIRLASKGYEGVHQPFGLNQYLVGGVEEIGAIFNHFEEILKELREEIEDEQAQKQE